MTTVRIRKTPPHDVFAQPLGLSAAKPCWLGEKTRTPFDTLRANGVALLLADKSESVANSLQAGQGRAGQEVYAKPEFTFGK